MDFGFAIMLSNISKLKMYAQCYTSILHYNGKCQFTVSDLILEVLGVIHLQHIGNTAQDRCLKYDHDKSLYTI